jgi:squamous cell carcinoma antigen recognized by T-cells 3
VAEARTRSIRITNLPPASQEGLLQQMLEKIVPVSRVEVFIDKQEAIVELKTPAVSPAVSSLLWYDTDIYI